MISAQKSWRHSFKSLNVNTIPCPDVSVFIGKPRFRVFVKNTWIALNLLTISKCGCLLTSSNRVAQNPYLGCTCLSILLLHISKHFEMAAFWWERALIPAEMKSFSISSRSTRLWHCCFKYYLAASSLWIWATVLNSSVGGRTRVLYTSSWICLFMRAFACTSPAFCELFSPWFLRFASSYLRLTSASK